MLGEQNVHESTRECELLVSPPPLRPSPPRRRGPGGRGSVARRGQLAPRRRGGRQVARQDPARLQRRGRAGRRGAGPRAPRAASPGRGASGAAAAGRAAGPPRHARAEGGCAAVWRQQRQLGAQHHPRVRELHPGPMHQVGPAAGACGPSTRTRRGGRAVPTAASPPRHPAAPRRPLNPPRPPPAPQRASAGRRAGQARQVCARERAAVRRARRARRLPHLRQGRAGGHHARDALHTGGARPARAPGARRAPGRAAVSRGGSWGPRRRARLWRGEANRVCRARTQRAAPHATRAVSPLSSPPPVPPRRPAHRCRRPTLRRCSRLTWPTPRRRSCASGSSTTATSRPQTVSRRARGGSRAR